MTTQAQFGTQWLQSLMPSSKKRNAMQVLKRFKNRVMEMCEKAAREDHDHCVFTLQRIEVGVPIQYNLEEIAVELAEWLERKGLRASIDASSPLCVYIEWSNKDLDEEPEPPLNLPPALSLAPLAPQDRRAAAPTAHPFFNWMQAPPQPPQSGPVQDQKTPIQQIRKTR